LRFGRLSLAALLAAFVAGCSLVQLAYNHADQWLLREADRYLELTDPQRQRLRAALRERLEQHRATELAGFVDFFAEAERAASDGLGRDEVATLMTRLQRLAEASVGGTIPPIADVLAGLAPDQIDHLRTVLADDDRRYRKRYVKPAAQRRVEKRTKFTVGAIEHWTGELDSAQQQLVSRQIAAWPDLSEDWSRYRTARSDGLIELLRNRPEPAMVERYLTSRWLAHGGRSPALQGGVTTVRDGIVDLLVAVDASLTAEQRARLLAKLRHYREELGDLLPSRRGALAAATASPVEVVD
jgi:hypothetical protein